MNTGPNLIAAGRRWQAEAALFQRMCVVALIELRADAAREHAEPDLNRTLGKMLVRARYRLEQQGVVIAGQIVAEAQSIPDYTKPRNEKREKKIPDFQYVFQDTRNCSMDASQQAVVAECKRLDKPEKGREYTELYVERGVNRFIDPDWAYAEGCPAAIMLGYLQGLEPEKALKEVNASLGDLSIDAIIQNGSWRKDGVTQLEHAFTRQPKPQNFALVHLWIDLRNTAKCRTP